MKVIYRTIDGREFERRGDASKHEAVVKAAQAAEKGFSDAEVVAALPPAIYAQTVAKLEKEAQSAEAVSVESEAKVG